MNNDRCEGCNAWHETIGNPYCENCQSVFEAGLAENENDGYEKGFEAGKEAFIEGQLMEEVVKLLPEYKAKKIKWLFKKIHQEIDRRKNCGIGWKSKHKKPAPEVSE